MNAAVGRWKRSSLGIFVLSVGVFATGIGMTTMFAPCYGPGALVTEVALGLAAIACMTFLVAALKGQSRWLWLGASVAGMCVMLLVGFWWTMLLCRGI